MQAGWHQEKFQPTRRLKPPRGWLCTSLSSFTSAPSLRDSGRVSHPDSPDSWKLRPLDPLRALSSVAKLPPGPRPPAPPWLVIRAQPSWHRQAVSFRCILALGTYTGCDSGGQAGIRNAGQGRQGASGLMWCRQRGGVAAGA